MRRGVGGAYCLHSLRGTYSRQSSLPARQHGQSLVMLGLLTDSDLGDAVKKVTD
jgi:hypothetical protein